MTKSKEEIWRERTLAQSESGMTIAHWCDKESINVNTFRKWKVEMNKMISSSAAPVQWAQLSRPSKQVSIKAEKNGITIEMTTQFESISDLTSLVKEMQAIC